MRSRLDRALAARIKERLVRLLPVLLSGLLGPAALLRENHAKGTQTRMGRPPLGNAAKKQVTLRLDPEVVDAFKAGGPGWQTRMNEVLAKAVGG